MASFATSLWRIVRWPLRIAVLLFVILFVLGLMDEHGYIDMESWLADDEPGYDANRAGTNPYRDLPDDPAVLDTLKEARAAQVMYISDSLRDTFLPSSLPGEDDYSLYSDYVRSLETRTDLTPLVLHETHVERTMMALAQRGGLAREPVADEPFDLPARFRALHDHWWALKTRPDAPERWEAQRFDATYLPPLLRSRDLGGDGDGPASPSPLSQATPLTLTPAQRAEADAKFAEWLARRRWQVSYLKRHPPSPLGFAPVAAATPSEDDPARLRGIWGTLFEDGVVAAGRRISTGLLQDNPTFRPIWGELATARVPFDWVDPEAAAEDEDKSEEEKQKSVMEQIDRMKESMARRDERRAKVEAFQRELFEEKKRKEEEAAAAAEAAHQTREKAEL
ncbi:hypothetical protein GGR56DRAFT_673582 [Xylariaceae sp. FL0804]|nr:hypothetical protein GGR56DRAFT_673582 [Xylariaceae sp. FL0804]